MSDTPTTLDLTNVLALDASVTGSTESPGFGVTTTGFVPKPFARLMSEKLALAKGLFGDDVDLQSGSVLRKLLELAALEDARTWAALGSMYDNLFASSAVGDALSRIGEDLGVPRPYLQATGTITLTLLPPLPDGVSNLTIPQGSRLSTPGGHAVATDVSVTLSAAAPVSDVPVVAFYPGPSHNLNPNLAADSGSHPQKIDRWNKADRLLTDLVAAEQEAGQPLIRIDHTAPMTGGDLQWPDQRYRRLVLQAPRSIWTVQALQLAISLVPGVRQVQIFDGSGGLDINQSIFGNFNFIERVFTADRDLGNPYYFTVLVAPTLHAIWDGPDGLLSQVQNAIEDLRPVGIFPSVVEAVQIGIGVQAKLVVQGLPLPTGSSQTVDASAAAAALRQRIYARLRQYIDNLAFGQPVRASEVIWSIMNEPGVADVLDLRLRRYPRDLNAMTFDAAVTAGSYAVVGGGDNVELQHNQIPVFVDIDDPIPLMIA
jgi:uncharacterized phage protein gp47/JayE